MRFNNIMGYFFMGLCILTGIVGIYMPEKDLLVPTICLYIVAQTHWIDEKLRKLRNENSGTILRN